MGGLVPISSEITSLQVNSFERILFMCKYAHRQFIIIYSTNDIFKFA